MPSATPTIPPIELEGQDVFSPDGDKVRDFNGLDVKLNAPGLSSWSIDVVDSLDDFSNGIVQSGSGSVTTQWDSTIRKHTPTELALDDGLYTLKLSSGGYSVSKDILIERVEFADDELFDQSGEFISPGDQLAGALDRYILAYKVALASARAARAAFGAAVK